MPDQSGSPEDRGKIAIWVVGGSAVGLITLSIVVLVAAGYSRTGNFNDTASMVYVSVLPLLGTWVGTVLAYYFSKDNFESASKSTSEHIQLALQQRLESMLVEPNMLPWAAIASITIKESKSDGDVFLSEIMEKIEGKVTRVPIFDHERKVKYVIHKGVLHEFISERSVEEAKDEKTFDVVQATLEDLLNYREMRALVSDTMAFVRRTATLAEASILSWARRMPLNCSGRSWVTRANSGSSGVASGERV